MEFLNFEKESKVDFSIRLTVIDVIVTFKDTTGGMFAIRVADWLTENIIGALNSTGKYQNVKREKKKKVFGGNVPVGLELMGGKDG